MQTIHHRDPKKIMKLSRLGSFHQSKLSFLRSFIREFKDWNFQTNLFELDKNGSHGSFAKDHMYSIATNIARENQ